MFKVVLRKASDRTVALVAGPEFGEEKIKDWCDGATSDRKDFEGAGAAIAHAVDQGAAITSVRSVPGWSDFELPILERIIGG